jgi:hypothetical protein
MHAGEPIHIDPARVEELIAHEQTLLEKREGYVFSDSLPPPASM